MSQRELATPPLPKLDLTQFDPSVHGVLKELMEEVEKIPMNSMALPELEACMKEKVSVDYADNKGGKTAEGTITHLLIPWGLHLKLDGEDKLELTFAGPSGVIHKVTDTKGNVVYENEKKPESYELLGCDTPEYT